MVNTKGGVGKSTLAVHLAVWFRDQGASVGLIDGDPQQSSSQWMREACPEVAVANAITPEEAAEISRRFLLSFDFVIADGPAGLDELSRTLLLVADLALFPITPSILDVRSVAQATSILRYARSINANRPAAKLVLNKLRTRDRISSELLTSTSDLGLEATQATLRDLQAYRDAAQQGTVVSRLGRRGRQAADEMNVLGQEILDWTMAQEEKHDRQFREGSTEARP